MKALIVNQCGTAITSSVLRGIHGIGLSLFTAGDAEKNRVRRSRSLLGLLMLLLKRRGYELYTIDEKIVIAKVSLCENLSEELEEIRKLVSISEKLELPRAKSRFRKTNGVIATFLAKKKRLRLQSYSGKK